MQQGSLNAAVIRSDVFLFCTRWMPFFEPYANLKFCKDLIQAAPLQNMLGIG